MKKNSVGTLLLLNFAFLIYSLSSVASKCAARENILSVKWIFLYGTMVCILMIYAVVWQIVLKKMDLITAYSNKAIVVIWGSVWGVILFQENISLIKMVGVLLIIIGIVVISKGEKASD